MNKRCRLDELREIAIENIILMRKLNEAKPSMDVHQIEVEQKRKIKFSHHLSRNAGKFSRHPFFVTENPAAKLYRNIVDSETSNGSKGQHLNQKTIRDQFNSILNSSIHQASLSTSKSVEGGRSRGTNSRNQITRAQTSLKPNSDYGNQTFYNQKRKSYGKKLNQVLISHDDLRS
jgi:hypothetical protein